MSAADLTILLASMGVVLTLARLLAERGRRLFRISVVAEIAAGLLLGPSVLGHLAPELHATLFPRSGPVASFMSGFSTVAVVLFLMVAGLEIDLSRVWRRGRAALAVTVAGIVFPFGVGYLAAELAPHALGAEPGADLRAFSLFFATALSISALPVIAKTLLELGLYKSDFGMTIMAAAIIEDLIGWMLFAMILGRSGAHPVGATVLMTIAFAAFMLVAFRWLANRFLARADIKDGPPGRAVAFALSMSFLAGAAAEWIGVHAVFGAFLAGVAIGDSAHLSDRTREIMEEFIGFIFAPIFFASIGLKVDFVRSFDPVAVCAVLAIACAGKILGCALGARFGGGLSARESWAVGFAMNSRGAMGVVLGAMGLEAGIIGERAFVALVVMAIVTSVLSGPAIARLMRS